jgi:hypothetical protein
MEAVTIMAVMVATAATAATLVAADVTAPIVLMEAVHMSARIARILIGPSQRLG